VEGGGSFAFLADGEAAEVRLSFADLDARARAIAARLQAEGLAGERALLLFSPGLEFLPAFFGCLYAGVVAVPAYPPRLNRPMPRLRAIVADCAPRAVLTSSSQLVDAGRWAEGVPELAGLARLATDSVPGAEADGWRDPGADRDSVAFLQYTSGSTAASKGVVLTHGNLLANSAAIRRCFGASSATRGVFWLPLYHDMGLIGGILQTIFCGGSSTLLSPVAFLQRPSRWLEAISRTGGTISGGPNFAYDLCARKVTAEQKAALDLSRWSVAFNGAEPIRPDTIDRFAEAFAPCGFRREAFLPCYGLAESTLLVAGNPPSDAPVVVEVRASGLARGEVIGAEPGDRDVRRLVGSGRASPGHALAIVDPGSGSRLPEGRVGEIWVAGPSVARGYWGRPGATAETFGATLAGTGGGPFLRTGDLGFLRGDELFVAGRLKDLIIVRGRNIYPQDVEWTMGRCHPLLRPEAVAAFSVEVEGEERLVVVGEVERRGKDHEEVLAAIREAVAAEHELDLHAVGLLRPMSLPKTSSGKVQRHAAREGFLAGTLDVVASWTSGAVTVGRSSVEVGSRTSVEVAAWLASKLAGPMGVHPDEVDPRKPFASFGLGSLRAVGLAGEMEEWLGRPLSPTLLYDHPTIEALALHLAGDRPAPDLAPVDGPRRPEDGGVAIIGIGCRFPGADGPDQFWRMLDGGVDAVREVPESRREALGGDRSLRAGFLDAVDRFDADFFGISPREAAQLDPQQRLLLEVAWEALEDAGQVPDRLAGGRVGVFVGISTNDYGRLPKAEGESGDAHALTGNAASIAANRISYVFDFRGPSLSVDTACSSSLVAVHLACRSLADGESSLALAGGVNLILAPEILANFAKAGFLAPDGRCKAFDARADGYVRGEGAGMVVLKPLARARADGDPILAVIRGAAVNQDGRTNGLTAPSVEAQEAVLRDAYRAAGVSPASIRYVEAHGTGTLLGDPIEARALGAVLSEGRAAADRCALGSVKTNIGHLEAAAGVAGLIKVAMAMKHDRIPPSLHFREPNPHIPFDRLPLEVRRDPGPWPVGDGPRLAGVSSFGFGGTNAHVVVEGPPASTADAAPDRGETARLLPISARDPAALRDLARSYREALASGASPADVVYSAGVHRSHHDHRLAVAAGTSGEAVEQIEAFLRGEVRAGVSAGRKAPGRRPRVAFVFSGQGVQWPGMGRDLIVTEPAFRSALEEVDRVLVPIAGWSAIAGLSADPAGSRLDQPEFAQPCQFALHVALAALWRSWGVTPDATVGHSLGEISAAHTAGAMGLEDAVRLVVLRGKLMQRALGQGRTVAVGLSPEEASRLVADSGGRLALAAINGPGSATLSGDPDAVADLVEDLRERGVFARVLGVDVAFHGPQMDALRPELEGGLAGLRPAAPSIPMYSTVTGHRVEGPTLDARYWGRNLRETVRFSEAVDRLIEANHDVFLELGPHPALAGPIGECLRHRAREGRVLSSLRRGRDGRSHLLGSLGALYAAGGSVDWAAVTPPGRFIRLPSYPWQRERHWSEPPRVEAPSNGSHPIGPGNGSLANGNGQHHPAPGTNGQARIIAARSELDDLLYELRWEPRARPDRPASGGGEPGRWLIFEDRGGVGRAVRGALEARGASCESVGPAEAGADVPIGLPDDPDGRPIRGVVDLRSLDHPGSDEMTVEDLEAAQAAGCGGALALVGALAGRKGPARLWLATVGAQPAGPAPRIAGLAQATLWGLGRSIALEYPDAWGGMFDLDPDDPAGDVEALVDGLLAPDGEDQVAFRGGARHVARLARVGAPSAAPIASKPRPEATYLVTGGLGDLGLKAARWLVNRGARRVVLVGRRGLPPRGSWDDLPAGHPGFSVVEAIRSMERDGATILVASADVADEPGMSALFDRLRATLPPIRGIVHAAGVIGPRSLRDADPGAFLATLRPKVAGTWVLHRLSRPMALDFFVGFSSASAAFGSKEGAYAAANQFLDAFAGWAGARGVPAVSVGWGPWASSAMAADRAKVHRRLGLEPIAADRAFEALGRAMDRGGRHVVAADVDWFAFRMVAGRRPFLGAIEEGARAEPEPDPAYPPALGRDELIRYFRDRVAEVLRLEPGRIDLERPLDSMGLDSLMAIELKSGVEADLRTSLPLTSLLEGPTITELAARTMERWAEPSASALSSPTALLAPSRLDVVAHPASTGQRSLWTLHRRMPGDAAYNMAGAARVRARLDVAALRRSIQSLVDRHASLRTTFAEVDGGPVQQVRGSADAWFRVEDASAWTGAELDRRLAEEARRPFDLESGPLFRTSLFSRSEVDHHLVMSAHHIVGDFWSIAVLMHELGRIYPAERIGAAADLPTPAIEYTDFARWQSEMLEGPEGERLRAYWAGRLAGPLPVLDLPTDRPRPAVRSHRGSTRSAHFDQALVDRLAGLGATRGASLYVVLLAAFQVLLGRLSGQDDLIVGSPVAGRDRANLTDVVGYFANPLPIRADLSGDPTFEEFLARARRVVFDGLEHQDLPFAEMVDRFGSARDPGRSPLFQVMFAFQKAQRLDAEGLTPFVLRESGPTMDLGEFPLESVSIDLRISQFDLTLSVAESEGGLSAAMEYNTDLYDAPTVDRMLGRFATLLRAIVASPGLAISRLSILPDDERRLVLDDWNATDAPAPAGVTIHRLFEDQAARDPGALAVACGPAVLTYGELNGRANRLAHHLRSIGIGPGSRVGVGLDRSTDLVVGLLGVLKAGAAYVPLDPEYPPERLAYFVEDAGIAAIVTHTRVLDRMPSGVARMIPVDRDPIAEGPDSDPAEVASPDELAYVIYTSGSTGAPKGVAVSHRNLVHSTHARALTYREPVGAFLMASSFAFDSSVAGLFGTLCRGGMLVLPPAGSHADPDRLAHLVAEHGVTHWLGVPSLLGLILSEAPTALLGSLRVAIVAGETCPRDLPGRVREALPLALLTNEYGPTEATVWSTVHPCRDEDGRSPIPIGRPIPNVRTYVLDDRLGPRPIGVAGELYIGGEGVARGYLDRPGLTADRFLPDPFAGRPGARMYRTGDLARWRADGSLDFLGRVDHQVKIRGYRVEPGEVEATLARHPEVREAVAVAREDSPGDVRLVAYIVARDRPGPPPGEYRRWLRDRLPDSLVPSAFVTIDAMPLSPNGKVDRKALPAPDFAPRGGTSEPPRDPTEAVLASIAAGVLGRGPVGVRDDFFDLGLDSILAIQLVSRARQAGLELDPGQVFEHPTVAGLAALAVPLSLAPIASPAAGPSPAEDEVEEEYPASPMQDGMLFHSRIDPGSGVYVQQFTCPIDGPVDRAAFEAAWRIVFDRHPVLRTSFGGIEAGRARQVVHRRVAPPLAFLDWRGAGAADIDRRQAAYLRDDRDRGFDPAIAPLVRLALIRTGAAAYRLILSNHHALMDGWCVPILLGEVLACYEAAIAGQAAGLPPTRPYRDYIEWLGSRDPARAVGYWRRELAGFREPTPIVLGPPVGGTADPTGERRVVLTEAATAALKEMARAHRLTLGSAVQGAWALLLGRYSGRDEVVFGVTVSGRPAELPGVESTVGLFINTLPARVGLPDEASLVPWLARLQSRLVEARRFESTPMVEIRAAAEVPRGLPLFESIVVFQNYPDDPAARDRARRLGVGEVRAFERTSFPLTLTAVPGPVLSLTARYDTDRFDGEGIDRLLGHLAILLGEMAARPRSRLADLSLAPAAAPSPPSWSSNGHGRVDLDRLSEQEVDAMIAELARGEAAHE